MMHLASPVAGIDQTWNSQPGEAKPYAARAVLGDTAVAAAAILDRYVRHRH
jgi:hypothetical protein